MGHERAVVVLLAGEIDLTNASAVVEYLCRHLVGQNQRIEVDLARVSFMDCSGIEACLETQRRARQAGYHMTFVNPTRSVARVIEILDLDRVLLQSVAS
jgi:anti-anti-sigma factor